MMGFVPILLRAESSADMISKGEALFVTTTWRNAGDAPAPAPLAGRLELTLGHQRAMETSTRSYTAYWNPYPATDAWLPGMTVRTTCRYNATPDWCGTFHMAVALCDPWHAGTAAAPVAIGDVEIGWGLGHPTVERTRRGWAVVYEKEQGAVSSEESASPVSLGDAETGRGQGHPSMDKTHATWTMAHHKVPDAASSEEISAQDTGKLTVVPLAEGIRCVGEYPALTQFGAFALRPEPPIWLLRQKGLPEHAALFRPARVQWRASREGKTLCYQGEAFADGGAMARCSLRFAPEGQSSQPPALRITLEEPWEAEGFELLELQMPALLAAAGADLSIVGFYGGGRLLTVADVPPMSVRHPYDTRGAAALLSGEAVLALECHCVDDALTVSVREVNRVKSGEIGCCFVHRVRGKGNVASIPVLHDHTAEVRIVDPGIGAPCWQTAARFWQRGLSPGKAQALYDRALLIKFLATWGPQPEPGQVRDDSPAAVTQLQKVLPFAQIQDTLRRLDLLLDGMPKIVYIGGFQKGGFDGGYPFVYDTDPRAGTVQDLREVIRSGAEHHAVVGLHDNFDSVVAGEHYDPRIVCVDEYGKPWRGWIWPAGLDYIASPAKYVATGLMEERVAKTVALYGLRGSYHIDVLTSELLRYDFDPLAPASAQKNLEAKLEIIAAFNRRGIDITSETVQHPFVGKIGYGLWLRDNRKDLLFPGEGYIPLTAMVYHGVIPYCAQGGNPTDMLWSLIRGNQFFFEEDHCDPKHLRWVFLQTLPLGLLYGRQILDIKEDGDRLTAVYGPDTRVSVDFGRKAYEITVDGEVVGRDWATLVPGFRPGCWLAYALEGGVFRMPVPGAMAGSSAIAACALTEEGEGQRIPCRLEGDTLCMEIPALTPVRVTVLREDG